MTKGLPKLTGAQVAALQMLAEGPLHSIRAGWAHGLKHPVAARATIDALERKGLAELRNVRTSAVITEAGRAELAASEAGR